MAISNVGGYANRYERFYTSNKAKASETNETSAAKTETGKSSGNEEYLKTLQKQVPYIKLQVGYGINTNNDGKVNVLDINPKLLEKMRNDPQAAKEYSQRLKDIEAAAKWVDGWKKSMGYTTIVRHGYVDENGNFSNFSITIRKDALNEKLRKEAQENSEELIERTRENAREKAEKLLADKLEQAEDGEIFLDDGDMQTVIDAAKEEENKDSETETRGGWVGVNVGKRVRQITAAKTPAQIQMVISMLDTDLSQVKDGKAQGMSDDEEIAKVEALIRQARQRASEIGAQSKEALAEAEKDMGFYTTLLM